jgi:hypothetical protein
VAKTDKTKEIDVTCTWRTTHRVEVPEDFVVTGNLSDFPPGVLDQIDSHNAELVDWE